MKIISCLFLLVLIIGGCSNHQTKIHTHEENSHNTESPYIGQEKWEIKSLSPDDVKGLLEGLGTPFGGMAKLGELNGYPGPRHVLDLSEKMNLTESQKIQIEGIFNEMKIESIKLGRQIIEVEKQMNEEFGNQSISKESLQIKLKKSAKIYGQLRFVHLKAHLQMIQILSQRQIILYNQLRGYSSKDCTPPEGHDSEIWKQHHGCG
ncbi:MAG: hypothetical protein H8E38_03530 [SAR324 cluster bacterium]|nr:hypothetical protein [SAR324 cluster bacterium]